MARRPLFERLPEIWRLLDRPKDVAGRPIGPPGLLERYLGVWDDAFDAVHGKVSALLDTRNIELLEDRWLELAADLVGQDWRSTKTRPWNRRRIRHAITRHSYRGTIAQLSDIITDCGGTSFSVQDNASKLLVLGKQGRLGCDDAYIMQADYWHDGAMVLKVNREIDYPALREDMVDFLPAGERWYYELSGEIYAIFEAIGVTVKAEGLSTTNAREGLLGFGVLDNDVFLSFDPNGAVTRSYWPIVWHVDFAFDGYLGTSLIEETALSVEPNGCVVRSYVPMVWRETGTYFEWSGSQQVCGESDFFGVMGGLVTVDSAFDVSWDVPIHQDPLDAVTALWQPQAQKTYEEV